MVKALSKISSVLPFSIFEILIYILVLVILIFLMYFIFCTIKNPKKILSLFLNFILNIISIIGIVYFIFVVLWEINYNRMDLKDSLIEYYNKTNNMAIKKVEYNEEDLIELYKFLIKKCNETRKKVSEDKYKVMKCNSNYKDTLSRAESVYLNVKILDRNLC